MGEGEGVFVLPACALMFLEKGFSVADCTAAAARRFCFSD